MGLVCQELTGDTDHADLSKLQAADIICSTPEKFDAVTRRRKDQGGMSFFADVSTALYVC